MTVPVLPVAPAVAPSPSMCLAARDGSPPGAALRDARECSQPIAVLLCDWRLCDGPDWLAAAQRLQAQQPPSALSVLMITGETDPARLQRLRDSGLPVLFKPVKAHALLRALAERAPGS